MEATSKSSDRPRKLGRGLNSLLSSGPAEVSIHLPPTPSAPAVSPTTTHSPGVETLSDVVRIPIGSISPSPFQPRRTWDAATLSALADSIRRTGLLQPILVRRAVGGYELVAGERRWRAATEAGLTHIPAIVKTLTDEQAAEHALIENVQREDLNAMDRAHALRALGDRFSLTHQHLAERLGLDRSTVANLIRLTELEPAIAALISSGSLSAGHGKALLGAPGGPARVTLAERAARQQMSVRELERLCKADPAPKPAAHISDRDQARLAVLGDLQRQIGQQLGTKVSIVTDRRGKKGRVTLEFYGLDHFDSLMTRLGVKVH
ncbi:MAG: ParB/RepB/Spo0J family partition protein [Leptolyngbya sp. PLA1]|nr:ParB/RepB/Spo0J family partition protein [Leptolyngbya sp. PLA1]